MEEWTRHFFWWGRGSGEGGNIILFWGGARSDACFFTLSRRTDMPNIFLRGTLRFFFFFHASFVFVTAGGEEDFNLFNQLVFLRGTLFGGHCSKEERLLGS